MKKHAMAICLVLLCSGSIQRVAAQTHFIPDAFMRTWLNGLAPGCVDANGYLNAEHPGLLGITYAFMHAEALDLTGIQYLHHLRDLNIEVGGDGVWFPAFPDSLERLTLQGSFIADTIPLLPSTLRFLDLSYYETTAGPQLMIPEPVPQGLDTLIFIGGAQEHEVMPVLPEGLSYLSIQGHAFFSRITLRNLPSELKTLRVIYGELDCLPLLPAGLEVVELSCGVIDCVPNLPDGLDSINICNIPYCGMLSGCPFGTGQVRGRIWNDVDQDWNCDAAETASPNDAVFVDGDLVGANADGQWAVGMDSGTYVVTPHAGHPLAVSVQPASRSAHIGSDAEVDGMNDFTYQLVPNITDLELYMATSAFIRPGFDRICAITVLNNGSLPSDGVVTVQFDPALELAEIEPSPTSLSGNSLQWSFTQLPISGTLHYTVLLHAPVDLPVGTEIMHHGVVATISPDLDLSDNAATKNTMVVAAYDPNEKSVEPSTLGPEEIVAGIELLYSIHFQNTGTAAAERVVITDTLSPNLSWESMRFIGSSHPCTWSISGGVLYFDHGLIDLPDSATDLLGSQGYVQFGMQPHTNLLAGDSITNSANIYFDTNTPVSTAPAILHVISSTGLSGPAPSSFLVSPVPASDHLSIHLTGPWNPEVSYAILTLDGRRIAQGIIRRSARLDLSCYPSGIYLLCIGDGQQQHLERFVKQ